MKKNFFFISLIIIALAASYGSYELLMPAQPGNRNIEIEIPKGATFRQAADILLKENLIGDETVFLIAGKLTKSDRKIRAGFYSIWTTMNPLAILHILRQGKVIEYEIKILEGDSLAEIADAFSRSGFASRDDFLSLSRDEDLMEEYDIDAPSIEGYIFPDTYMVPKGMSLEDAVGVMLDKMQEKYSGALEEEAEAKGLTERDVLTLASIIEKESVVDSERPLISAVYHNRLKRHMPLQADPTAIYGCKTSREKITRSDLRRKSPYNTYIVKGLPPGPIASPGLKSIEAAIRPADVPYLFFVSYDDRTHVFSTTLADHMNAVRLYRERKLQMQDTQEEEANVKPASS
jgi:UPF0755 protein